MGCAWAACEREATVMFSDLRGFTSFAESLEPDQVITILNRYLTAMVDDAILAHGGTLVDYMGDGIMAVFGAPIEMADHADRALAAARDKLGELERSTSGCGRDGLREVLPHGHRARTRAASCPATSARSSGWPTRRSATRRTPPRGSRR